MNPVYKILLLIYSSSMIVNGQFSSNEIVKLEIRKVEFDLLTVIKVECDNFEMYFKDSFDKIELFPQDEKFGDILKLVNPKVLESKLMTNTPDVRAKIMIYYSDSTIDTLCVGSFNLLLNGESKILTEGLTELLDSI